MEKWKCWLFPWKLRESDWRFSVGKDCPWTTLQETPILFTSSFFPDNYHDLELHCLFIFMWWYLAHHLCKEVVRLTCCSDSDDFCYQVGFHVSIYWGNVWQRSENADLIKNAQWPCTHLSLTIKRSQCKRYEQSPHGLLS